MHLVATLFATALLTAPSDPSTLAPSDDADATPDDADAMPGDTDAVSDDADAASDDPDAILDDPEVAPDEADAALDEVDAALDDAVTPTAEDSAPGHAAANPTDVDAVTADADLPRGDAALSLARLFAPLVLLEGDYRQRAHEAEGNSGFALARARLGMRLSPTDWMSATGVIELVGDHGPYLLDGYATFTPLRWLTLTAGYAKPPLFASFRHEPVASLPMPVRSSVVNEMRVRRDLGAEARFTPHRAPLEAIVRLGNGASSILGNDDARPTGYAALDLVLGRAWVGARDHRFGLRLGGATLLDDAAEHDTVAGRTPIGFTYVRPVVAVGLRSITEAHAIGYAGPVRLVVEGAYAYESRRMDDDGDATTPPVAVDAVGSWGATAELTWTIRGTDREVGARPAGPGRRDGAWDGGALELSGRADRLWLGRGTDEVPDAGGTTGSLSLKWWPTSFLALDVYGDATRFDVPPIETPDRDWSWTALVRGSFFWGARAPR